MLVAKETQQPLLFSEKKRITNLVLPKLNIGSALLANLNCKCLIYILSFRLKISISSYLFCRLIPIFFKKGISFSSQRKTAIN